MICVDDIVFLWCRSFGARVRREEGGNEAVQHERGSALHLVWFIFELYYIKGTRDPFSGCVQVSSLCIIKRVG